MSALIFYSGITAITLFEGLGIANGQQMAYYLILLLPGALFVTEYFKNGNKQQTLPFGFIKLYSLFLGTALIGIFFGVDWQRSFASWWVLLAIGLIFIFVYQNQVLLRNYFVLWCSSLSVFFLLWSFGLNIIPLKVITFLIPSSGNNWVWASYGRHNHLGDWLLLVTIICLYQLYKQKHLKICLIGLGIFIPALIWAGSRAAIVSLFIIMVVFLLIRIRAYRLSRILIVSSSIILMVLTIGLIQITLLSHTSRPLFSPRDQYYSHALWATKTRPVTGLGLGNYIYASVKNSINNPDNWTDTAHNFLADYFAEGGLILGTLMIILVIYLMRRQDKRRIFFWLFLIMLINFLFDYIYRFNAIWVIFFVIAALGYQEKKFIITSNWLGIIGGLLLLIMVQLQIFSQLALKQQQYDRALFFYPFNKEAWIGSIKANQNTFQPPVLLTWGKIMFSGDTSVLEKVGDISLEFDKKQALKNYEQAYYWDVYSGKTLFKKIYLLKKELKGQRIAFQFIKMHFTQLEKINHTKTSISFAVTEAQQFCQQIYNYQCPYQLD